MKRRTVLTLPALAASPVLATPQGAAAQPAAAAAQRRLSVLADAEAAEGRFLRSGVRLDGPALAAGEQVSVTLAASGSASDADFDFGLLDALDNAAAASDGTVRHDGRGGLTLLPGHPNPLVWTAFVRPWHSRAGDRQRRLTLSDPRGARLATASASSTLRNTKPRPEGMEDFLRPGDAWFDLDHPGAVTLDAAGRVEAVRDRRSGAVLAQPDAARRPAFRRGEAGTPAAIETAGSQYLECDDPGLCAALDAGAKARLMVVVVGELTGTNGSAPMDIMGIGRRDQPSRFAFLLRAEGGSGNPFSLGRLVELSGKPRYAAGVVLPTPTEPGRRQVLMASWDGLHHILRRDEAETAETATVPLGAAPNDLIVLGGRAPFNAVTGARFRYRAVLMLRRNLDNHERQLLGDALARRYGTPPVSVVPLLDLKQAGYRLRKADHFAGPPRLESGDGRGWTPRQGGPANVNENGGSLWSGAAKAGSFTIDPTAPRVRAAGYTPLRPVDDPLGGLNLALEPTPPALAPLTVTSNMGPVGPLPYLSGAINTRAWVGAWDMNGVWSTLLEGWEGQGQWSAAWKLPTHGGWPPEQDDMEHFGRKDHASASCHPHVDPKPTTVSFPVEDGLNEYLSENTPTHIRFYCNRVMVSERERPLQHQVIWYFQMNNECGRGANWMPAPSADQRWPAFTRLQHWMLFRKPVAAPALIPGTLPETAAILDAMGPAVRPAAGSARARAIDGSVRLLRSMTPFWHPGRSAWDMLDGLGFCTGLDEAAALLNWKAPRGPALGRGNGLRWSAAGGFAGSPGTAGLDTRLAPAPDWGGAFTTPLHHVSVIVDQVSGNDLLLASGTDGSAKLQLRLQPLGPAPRWLYAPVHGSALPCATPRGFAGHILFSRFGRTVMPYLDGDYGATVGGIGSETAPDGQSVRLLVGSSARLQGWSLGGALTPEEVALFHREAVAPVLAALRG
ncbi:hypothetical protein LPC08_09600 [Roseomonas sp. OT10]|uniref:hypothetical protein n=1 Tax=Roseomonas cutis TaxID=2897332 RepID=UPI001E641713|nr:hypothetical protein [Roseomonas sp. OT10]UFN50836.1 hypothetical protein LPC08_09600 [Roseomonas sp. OT10]